MSWLDFIFVLVMASGNSYDSFYFYMRPKLSFFIFTQQDKQETPTLTKSLKPAIYSPVAQIFKEVVHERLSWTWMVFAPVSHCLKWVMHQVSKSLFCNWVKVEALTCPKQSRGQILHNKMTLPPSCHGSVLHCRTPGPPPVCPVPNWEGPACTNTGTSLQT